MDKNNGGPAFPRFVPDGHYNGSIDEQGMTLRDYFAAKADVPWNAVFETLAAMGEKSPTVDRLVEYRALIKYAEADAMLRAREQ